MRAILGLPIAEITLEKAGASAVILASENSENPTFAGIEAVAGLPKTDFRLFGKPTSRPYRRMGVILVNETLTSTSMEKMVERAQKTANLVTVNA